MKKKSILIAIIAALFCGTLSFSQQVDVFSATTIVELIEEKISSIQSFIGTFTYIYDETSKWGYIYYEGPDKFALEYWSGGVKSDDGILCDGTAIYLIFSSQNIAIKEHLDDTSLDTPLIGWNIDRLQREYTPVLPADGYEVLYDDELCYKLEFSPKMNTAGFREMYMIVSTDGLIKKVTATSQMGIELVLAISYTSFNVTIDDDEHFSFDPDENTQIYENMLIPAGVD